MFLPQWSLTHWPLDQVHFCCCHMNSQRDPLGCRQLIELTAETPLSFRIPSSTDSCSYLCFMVKKCSVTAGSIIHMMTVCSRSSSQMGLEPIQAAQGTKQGSSLDVMPVQKRQAFLKSYTRRNSKT